MAPTVAAYAPTTAVSPDSDTETPKASPAAPSLAVSFCSSVHTPPDRTYTYAAPCWTLAPTFAACAPTTAVSPDTDTEQPKELFAAPSLAVSFCCSVHVPPDRTYTYAAPCWVLAPTVAFGTPTTAVSPDTDTEKPKRLFAAPSLAVSFCCSVHVPPDRTYT